MKKKTIIWKVRKKKLIIYNEKVTKRKQMHLTQIIIEIKIYIKVQTGTDTNK